MQKERGVPASTRGWWWERSVLYAAQRINWLGFLLAALLAAPLPGEVLKYPFKLEEGNHLSLLFCSLLPYVAIPKTFRAGWRTDAGFN